MAAANGSSALQAVYAELQTAISGLSGDAQTTIERQLADTRELARQARELSATIERAADDLFDALIAIREGVTASGVLRGEKLARVAIEALAGSGRDQPIHYRDWYQLLRNQGERVGGKDPLATFLTALSRSDRVEAVGARTGLYRLAETEAGEA